MRYALIPVKELDKAKARLAGVLDSASRRELVLSMLRDVLDAATGCEALDGVAVVTRDAELLTLAAEAGVEGMAEPGGLNEALTSAAEKLRERGMTRLLVLAADLPLADSESIGAAMGAEGDVAVVPSRDGGTNVLAMTQGAIDFHFGPESAKRHLAAAAGLRAVTLDLPRLALDIDTPADLDSLRALPAGQPGRHTRAALERIAPASAREA